MIQNLLHMNRLISLSMAALMALAVSCSKDNKPGNDDPVKYGVDGKTPLPEAVDIGMEVDGQHILWASFNLGASKEWEFGDYYAWGETDPYYSSLKPLSWKNGKEQGYDWASYSLANGGSSKITRYCQEENAGSWDGGGSAPDNQFELLPEDDAASKKLGGKWKIPTKRMFEALLALKDSPDYIWEQWAETTNDKGETVHGLKITLKSTGKYIFFPSSGYSVKTEISKYAAEFGEYWTSSLSTGLLDEFPPAPVEAYHAFYMYFNSENAGRSLTIRYNGLTIRPVCVE